MTSVARALALFVFLAVFVLAGGLYSPPVSDGFGDEADISLANLPPLPKWAKAPLPDFSRYRDVNERKAAFFGYLYPRIALANSRILVERQYLQTLAGKATLTESEQMWLERQSERLRVNAEGQARFAALEKKLDIIPPSLILAQAANESAWGQSRFATRGNNLFGQWCFTEGCGLVPTNRPEGANHEVATFSSPYYSVRSYIQNLNRHNAYQKVRTLRTEDRRNNRRISGLRLAGGLVSYSERGQEYIAEIRAMIRFNELQAYDKAFSALLDDRSPSRLTMLAAAENGAQLMPEQL
ncbi:MAG: glucosaminidase domain-containing protein [Alteromonadaceae bacterium]|nr:glucosaminidase domain-containing protein [Alteromonadaceae bacterium]